MAKAYLGGDALGVWILLRVSAQFRPEGGATGAMVGVMLTLCVALGAAALMQGRRRRAQLPAGVAAVLRAEQFRFGRAGWLLLGVIGLVVSAMAIMVIALS